MSLRGTSSKMRGLRHTESTQLKTDVLTTPIGEVVIVCDNDALCALDFSDFTDRMHALLRRRYGMYELRRCADWLGMTAAVERYFRGDLTSIEKLPVRTGGTPYQRRVWERLRAIPWGETRSYGAIATTVGGTHARAVGHANSLNPIAIVIPCHRVIAANAALTGYAGGLARKSWLLDHEAQVRAPALSFGARTLC